MSFFRWLLFPLRARVARERFYRLPPRVSVLSPEEFTRLYREHGNVVETAMIVPPRLGSADFGRIVTVTKPTTVRDFAGR
jgi:hypothetical protein